MTRVLKDQSANPAATPFQTLNQSMASSSTAPNSIITPSPIPMPPKQQDSPQQAPILDDQQQDPETTKKKQTLCPKARLRIHLDDLSHPAITKFTSSIPLSTLLEEAIHNVQAHLFTPPSSNPDTESDTSTTRPPPQRPITPKPTWQPQEVRSLTLILRPMDGVAYTTGTTLDEAHKEIHLSLDYIAAIIKKFFASSPTTSTSPTADASFLHEIRGVVTHEAVHAFQHNGHGSCPGGLIEGIADYVRMKAGLGAEHWNPWPATPKSRGEKWDEGYQKTAWFLEWIEEHVGGTGCIGRLNESMRDRRWEDGKVWEGVMLGLSVKECWDLYKGDWESMNKRHEGKGEEGDEKRGTDGTERLLRHAMELDSINKKYQSG